MDRSLRRRGELLVVVGALLGAFIGVALGLVVDDAQHSMAVAAPGRARGAVQAANPPSSQPSASQAVGPGNQADAGRQQAASADRPDKRHGDARKDGQENRGKDKADKGKDKADKGNDRSAVH